jgi:hypothetical protein
MDMIKLFLVHMNLVVEILSRLEHEVEAQDTRLKIVEVMLLNVLSSHPELRNELPPEALRDWAVAIHQRSKRERHSEL